ncbi:response regulator [Spirosoma sp. HMF4905]|uniref:histidine kinase n=1 Tax=Spirosoma arboris TaxID=2682092 RepID=A0A7K1SQA5_9BACT|nr:hybrid sensor histidine kinase/response regulator transcription factor [Spirosoma arboris]MVM35988.1 response regulator [Spirosoma arboris]
MKWLSRTIYCIWAVGLLTTVGRTQDTQGRFRFEHITMDEGLSHSDALAVTQDKQGFIWIGTNKGINRYDGYGLKKYGLPMNQLSGLSSNRIRVLHVSPDSSVWAGGERAGLFWFDATHDKFISIRALPCPPAYRHLIPLLAQTSVFAITSDRQGNVWVGTQESLFRLAIDQEGRIRYLQQISVRDPITHSIHPVRKLVTDQQGKVWIGTLDAGLWMVQGSNQEMPILKATQVSSFPNLTIHALHLDTHGDLWIGTADQVFWASVSMIRQPATFQAQSLKQHFTDVEGLFLDSMDRLWIGTNAGLWQIGSGPASGKTPPVLETNARIFIPDATDSYSITSVWVHDMLEDRFHNLWLATSAGGLNQVRLQSKPFVHLQLQASRQTTLADNYVLAITKDEQRNRLWIGSLNGLARYDLGQKTFRYYLRTPSSANVNMIGVSALFRSSAGTVWVGTRNKGLFLLNDTNTLPTLLSAIPNLSWANVRIESITEDRFHTIWVATSGTGLHRFTLQGRYIRSYAEANQTLLSNQLSSLYSDNQQDLLWVSTKNAGLLKMQITPTSLSLVRQFKHDPNREASLSSNFTWSVQKDPQGNLWVGTIGGGLNRLVTNAGGQEVIQRYNQQVPETDVEALLLDKAGTVWIGGEGLFQFNPATRQVLHYTVSDGLQSNSFKVGAAYRATDGTLYVGGINGVTAFNPSAIRSNPVPPQMQIVGLRVMNQPVTSGDTINGRVLISKPFSEPQALRIKPSENDFTIEFVGLNFASPRQNRYAYQLVGYNDDWVYPIDGQRTANFANLPAGDYTFRVKGSNGDGVWSTPLTTLSLTVLPPWWRTWWAYLLYALTIGAALFIYRRIELTQQDLKNKLELEQFKVEKEKEMTDTKLRFFTNVSHELRTPLTLILGPMEELVTALGQQTGFKEKVTLMHRQTHKLFDLVNQLLEFRKVESGHISLRVTQGDIISFLNELFILFKLKAEEQQLNYELTIPPTAVPLYFDTSKLEIILVNLLSNAFKYSPQGGRVQVSAEVIGQPDRPAIFQAGKLTDNFIEITVRDWGVGMRPDEVDKIFDPYYQASHTETLRVMGTGIGLSLVAQLVERHQGDISVQSELAHGTTFTVKLPFGKAHLKATDFGADTSPIIKDATYLPAAETRPERLSLPADLKNTFRLLVVEDNDDLRQYVEGIFTSEFDVHTAVDGLEGWNKALEIQPDVVISDVMMPRSDGLELCRKIKQNPKTAHIPVILLTARTAATHELEGLEMGADDYIAKPFNSQLLQARVVTLLLNRYRLREYYKRQILLEPTEIDIPDADRQFLEQAMSIVEKNMTNPEFNVPELVREMAMSQSVFYRRIKNMTGQTVVEFIRDVRMKRGAYLLANTSLRISDVAMQVGIDDPKQFSKNFQKLYNISPSDYIKQFRNKENAGEQTTLIDFPSI